MLTLTALTIGLHIGSVHLPQADYLSDVNPGIYVRHDNGITAGVYRNSFNRMSVYGGYTFSHGPFDLTVGLISGYQYRPTPVACDPVTQPGWTDCWKDLGGTSSRIAPLVAPSVRLPALIGITPRLTFLPKLNAKGHNTFHLSVERHF